MSTPHSHVYNYLNALCWQTQLLFRAANPGVSYEYTVPNENITRIPEFSWKYMDWSACTATCGGGTQVSQPQCIEKEAGLVEETYCSPLDKPPEKTQTCNTKTCPPRSVTLYSGHLLITSDSRCYIVQVVGGPVAVLLQDLRR